MKRTGAGLLVNDDVVVPAPPEPERLRTVVNIQSADSRAGAMLAVARAVGAGVNQLCGRKLVVAVDVRKADNGGIDVLVGLELEEQA